MAGKRGVVLGLVICFRCRRTTCACLAGLPIAPVTVAARGRVTRAIAWLGGACVAGSVLGAALALLLGG
jgi:hypothetical protein